MRKLFRTLLEVDGYRVDTVSSGKEAIARINKGERPDFIVLDVLMAEMNGFETIQELLRLDRSLNVIMMTCNWRIDTRADITGKSRREREMPLPF